MGNEFIPSNVARQAEEADRLMKGVSEGTLVNVVNNEPANPPNPDVTNNNNVAPAQNLMTDTIVSNNADPSNQTASYWEQRFKVSEGISKKQGAEITELRNLLSMKEQTISNLSRVINMQQSNSPAQNADPTAPATHSPGFDNYRPAVNNNAVTALDTKLFEGYGSEMVDAIKQLNALIAENKELKAQLNTVGTEVQRSVEDKFFDALEVKVPDWEVINTDQRWLEWLKKQDPMTGILRQNLLSDARAKYDLNRAVAVFNAFKTEHGISSNNNAPGSVNSINNNNSPSITNSRLGDFEVPNEMSGFTHAPNNQQVITKEMVDKASKDYVKGTITEAQFNDICDRWQKQYASTVQQGGI